MSKFAVVTISYNQASYLRECIESVIQQESSGVELDYIVVDPGSSDGSREIIQSYGVKIKHLFEKDKGPADGLNKGFGAVEGDYYYYLNSDDIVLPGTFSAVQKIFAEDSEIDIICGACWVIDEAGGRLRRAFSDGISARAYAYGAGIAIQPSTFIRGRVFKESSGFNLNNKSNWDGELLLDLVLAGAKVKVVHDLFSCYRVHSGGITGSGRMAKLHEEHSLRMFEKVLGRSPSWFDGPFFLLYRLKKLIANPRATAERFFRGPIFKAKA